MNNKIKILVVEDHPAIVEAIKKNLSTKKFHVEFCQYAKGALDMLKEHKFHILIADLRLKEEGNAFTLLEKARNKLSEIYLIVYTSFTRPWLFIKLERMGIHPNCVIDKTEFPDWENLCENILKGETYFSQSAINSKQRVADNGLYDFMQLSPRKWEVMLVMAKGNNDKEVAQICNISKFTANGYRKLFYKLLDVYDVASFILKFQELGYFEIEG